MRPAACLSALFALVLGGCFGCFSRVSVETVRPGAAVEAPATFYHGDFSALLAAHVDARGLVDYPALRADAARLDAYLVRLAETDPANLPPADRLAFWLNAYNAYTLKLVVDNYPVESILETVSGPFVPSVNSPFSVPFAVVGGEEYTLDAIEHDIVRGGFSEPRIHFALVCGALSCPPLRAEAYDGARLDAQLGDQARRFLHDAAKNRVTLEGAALSKLFDWYEGDLGGSEEGVQRFVAPYFDGPLREALEAARLDVTFLDYDWSLNAQGRPSSSPRP